MMSHCSYRRKWKWLQDPEQLFLAGNGRIVVVKEDDLNSNLQVDKQVDLTEN